MTEDVNGKRLTKSYKQHLRERLQTVEQVRRYLMVLIEEKEPLPVLLLGLRNIMDAHSEMTTKMRVKALEAENVRLQEIIDDPPKPLEGGARSRILTEMRARNIDEAIDMWRDAQKRLKKLESSGKKRGRR